MAMASSGVLIPRTRKRPATSEMSLLPLSNLATRRALSFRASKYRAVGTNTVRPASREFGAKRPHHRHISRKARGDEAGIIHRGRLLACKSQHQERHSDAVVHVGRNRAAAGGAAAAVHDQVVAIDLDLDAIGE